MYNKFFRIFISILSLFLVLTISGGMNAMGTSLMLGAGQEFRFDLPLEAGKSYVISMALRTDLDDASVTMTLCHIKNNNEVIEHHLTRQELPNGGGWAIVSVPDVQTQTSPGRFELILTADKEGRYYWKDLKVERSYTSSQNTYEYWSEKLATQGTFYTDWWSMLVTLV